MRGRPRKSDIIDDLEGNPGKRRRKKAELGKQSEKSGNLGFPSGMCKQSRNQARRLAAILEHSGVDVDVFRPSFERWCILTHLLLDRTAMLKKGHEDRGKIEGFLLKASSELRQIEQHFVRLMNEFGDKKEEPADPMAEFLSGGKPDLKAVN